MQSEYKERQEDAKGVSVGLDFFGILTIFMSLLTEKVTLSYTLH